MTTYDTAEHLLAQAQDVLNWHVTSIANGLCIQCGLPGPCWHRETAAVMFSRYSRLPRRLPGASRPELVGARRVDVDRARASAGES